MALTRPIKISNTSIIIPNHSLLLLTLILNVFNCFSVPAPRRLRFKVLSPDKLLVTWKEPKGDFDSYLFLYNSIPGRTSSTADTRRSQALKGGGSSLMFWCRWISLWLGFSVCHEGLCNWLLIRAHVRGLHSWVSWRTQRLSCTSARSETKRCFFCCCCEPVACQQVWKWDWQEQRAAAAPLTQAGGQTRTCERQRHS